MTGKFSNLNEMPKIHEREKIVTTARLKIAVAIEDAVKDLTVWEAIKVVTGASSEYLQSLAKHNIRMERHGDPDKPGGFSSD